MSLALKAVTEVLVIVSLTSAASVGMILEKWPSSTMRAAHLIIRAAFLNLVIIGAQSSALLFRALYGTKPFLAAGDQLMRSIEDAQKGDSLGGLHFTLVIRPPVKRISEQCKMYLDPACTSRLCA